MGRENYGSVIFSYREDSVYLLGFFGGWTVTDALLVYGEGVVSRGNEALYPQKDLSPFGASMQKLHQNEIEPTILLGSSYTLAGKGTIYFEYAYYGPGYSHAEANQYNNLKLKASETFELGGLGSGLGQRTLGQTAITGLRLLRKNYALLQYTQSNILNAVDLTFRWTQNLDDGSGQFTALASYVLGNHLELFSVLTINEGSKDSEFRSILGFNGILGLKYTL